MPRIDIPSEKIAALCSRWQVVELALFGSVLREDFGPESDVDILVRFDPKARHTLLDIVQMQDELSATLGRKADLIERAAVEQSPNSSSTVSSEVQKPISRKIMNLWIDQIDIDLKCSGKFCLESLRNTPLFIGISAIAFVKYVVSMMETPHVRPRQECRHLSIPSESPKTAAKEIASSKPSSQPSGRLDKLAASGAFDQLLRSAARFAERVMVLSEHSCDAHDRPDANVVSIGPALIFERLWRETGCQKVVRKLLAARVYRFDVERAVFMTVLHRLMVSGSDRSALQWRRDQAIDGTEALELQHLYRAMGWLGEALGEREPDDAPSPRRICGHVFCSFLALVLRDELIRRIDNAGVTAEWDDILRDLNALTETAITYNGKTFVVRSNAVGVAGRIAQ